MFIGVFTAILGIVLYVLLNWSYTVAVFTDPGNPAETSNSKSSYSQLPISESRARYAALQVNSSGEARYCKKCQCPKPDRAHHCSTCKRCVLKMDHHCPWLAACVGLHNYKAFLLFLIYTTFFCWTCLGVSGSWVWNEVLTDGQYMDVMMPVHYVLLVVVSGIIGVVLTGFTGWHFSLAWRGLTTIECLEKTRYLAPLRRSAQQQPYNASGHLANGNEEQTYGQQFLEIHANAVPGVTRPEEGEIRQSAPQSSLSGFSSRQHQSYSDLEASRERDRYEEYLNEQDSEKLPNAFDLGRRRNLIHLFGEAPLYWFLPICNTTGDGWNWETSEKWLEARTELDRRREERANEQEMWRSRDRRKNYANGGKMVARDARGERQWLDLPPRGSSRQSSSGSRSPKADKILGREPDQYYDDFDRGQKPRNDVLLSTLRGSSKDQYSDSDSYSNSDA